MYLFFTFGSAGSLLLLRLFFSCGEQGLLFSCSTRASHCGGFTRGAQAPGHEGFSRCGLWAQQLWLTGSRALA